MLSTKIACPGSNKVSIGKLQGSCAKIQYTSKDKCFVKQIHGSLSIAFSSSFHGNYSSLCLMIFDTCVLVIIVGFVSKMLSSRAINFISNLSYLLHCCTLPDKRFLSHCMCLYQVMMTLHFLNAVANDSESIQHSKITS